MDIYGSLHEAESEFGCCMVLRPEGRCVMQHLSYAGACRGIPKYVGALTLQKYVLPLVCPSLFHKSFDRLPEKIRYTCSATDFSHTRTHIHRSFALPPSPFSHHGVFHWICRTRVSALRTHMSDKASFFPALHCPSSAIPPATMVAEG